MRVTLDINTRLWLIEHLGKIRSTKVRFIWCEANIHDLMVELHEYDVTTRYLPGHLKALDPEASRRTIDIPETILEGLAHLLFSDPDAHRPADAMTVYMVDALELQNVH